MESLTLKRDSLLKRDSMLKRDSRIRLWSIMYHSSRKLMNGYVNTREVTASTAMDYAWEGTEEDLTALRVSLPREMPACLRDASELEEEDFVQPTWEFA